jgi:cytoskeletal protein RodZ
MRQDFKELGDNFKARRKELNLSLKEAENATSIRTTYLQAIEDGEMNKLISPVYAQGFVRQYASFLGMDGERLIRENNDLFTKPAPQEFAYGIGTMEMRGNPGAGVKWFPNAVWIVIFVLIIAAAWLSARFFEVI